MERVPINTRKQCLALPRLPHNQRPRCQRPRTMPPWERSPPRSRRNIQPNCPILIRNRQSSPIHRIPGSSTRKGDRLMILRNSIRPSIKRPTKKGSTACIVRKNGNIQRGGRAHTRITTAALSSRSKTNTAPKQCQITNSSGASPSNRHRHTRTRRRSHRCLQTKIPAPDSAVLPQRGHRGAGIRRIDHTQRNHRQRRRRRRLRNQPPPPTKPRRQHPRHQQHNQPHPPQHNPAPRKPTHRNLPQIASRPRKHSPPDPRPEHADYNTPPMLPPPD